MTATIAAVMPRRAVPTAPTMTTAIIDRALQRRATETWKKITAGAAAGATARPKPISGWGAAGRRIAMVGAVVIMTRTRAVAGMGNPNGIPKPPGKGGKGAGATALPSATTGTKNATNAMAARDRIRTNPIAARRGASSTTTGAATKAGAVGAAAVPMKRTMTIVARGEAAVVMAGGMAILAAMPPQPVAVGRTAIDGPQLAPGAIRLPERQAS